MLFGCLFVFTQCCLCACLLALHFPSIIPLGTALPSNTHTFSSCRVVVNKTGSPLQTKETDRGFRDQLWLRCSSGCRLLSADSWETKFDMIFFFFSGKLEVYKHFQKCSSTNCVKKSLDSAAIMSSVSNCTLLSSHYSNCDCAQTYCKCFNFSCSLFSFLYFLFLLVNGL